MVSPQYPGRYRGISGWKDGRQPVPGRLPAAVQEGFHNKRRQYFPGVNLRLSSS